MNKLKIVVYVITILFLCTNAYGDNPSATEILKKVAAAYKSMKTYKVEGNINIEDSTNTTNSLVNYSFSILMKKPNLYLITWTPTTMPCDINYTRVAWNDGTQAYFCYFGLKLYAKMASDEMTINQASFMNGPGFFLPALFLPAFKGHEAPFAWLKDPKIEKVEKIGEEECYVISGSSPFYEREFLWVSMTGYQIRKYSHSDDPPEGGRLGMTNEEIMRLKRMKEERKRLNIRSSETQFYTEISSPELNKEDFNYIVPQGIELKDKWPYPDKLLYPIK